MPTADPRYFERDPNAAARLAAQFGAGAGTAEQLIEANSLRYSTELTAAVNQPRDDEATRELARADVASTLGLEDEYAVLDFAVRGRYVTYVAEDPSGRAFKGVLLRQGDSLEAPEGGDASPQQAVLQARVQGAAQLEEARKEADRILEDAKRQAAQLLAEAAQQNVEAEQEAAQATQEASEDEQGTPTEASSERTPEGPKQQRQQAGQKSAGKPGDQKRGGRPAESSEQPGNDPADSPEGIGNK